MDFSRFENLTINGRSFQKLIRVSDGAVLFEKNPQPKPWFAIEYDGSYSNIFMGNVFAGLFGGNVEINWGDGTTEIISVPGGGSTTIRRDGIENTRTISFKAPATFFYSKSNSFNQKWYN